MLFKSSIIEELRKKYGHLPDYKVPQIVELDRDDNLRCEKIIIDEVISQAETEKQNEWISKLISKKGEHFLGAWFEIMLFDWLNRIGHTKIEPIIQGQKIDFVLTHNQVDIYIEAHAIAKDYILDSVVKEFIQKLRSIEKPYCIGILECEISSNYSTKKITKDVVEWLSANPSNEFELNTNDAKIHLIAIPTPENPKVTVIFSSEIKKEFNDLKNALHKKARQHKNIRNLGIPYILAFLLDNPEFTEIDIIKAWYGDIQFHYDKNSRAISRSSFDKKGILFGGEKINHKSVSGLLIFKKYRNDTLKRHDFDVFFVQNHFAKTFIDYKIFPTKNNFIRLEKERGGVYLGWEK
ncbi:MAG: hypothetical protein ACTSUK_06470 [Promethearchaeota archaeon]